MVSFDTNILVYATLLAPLAKTHRARDLLVRGMRAGSCILLLPRNSVAWQFAGGDRGREVRRRSTRGERCYLYKAPRMTIFRRRSIW